MKVVRILILLFMVFVAVWMVAFPLMFHSKRLHEARRAHAEAPSEGTRLGLEEAIRLDWKDLKLFEIRCVGILLVFGYLFIRTKPKTVDSTLPSGR